MKKQTIQTTTPTFESVWAALQETDRILTEKQAKTDRQMKAHERFLTKKLAESNRFLTEKQAETDRQMRELQKQYGGISHNNGEMAEQYFYSAFKRNKRFVNETFDEVIRNKCIRNGEWDAEFDLLLINGKSVAIIEVKYRATSDNITIEKLISRIEPFKVLFPKYINHNIYLGVAALSFDKLLAKQLREAGIATIYQEGKKVVVWDREVRVF